MIVAYFICMRADIYQYNTDDVPVITDTHVPHMEEKMRDLHMHDEREFVILLANLYCQPLSKSTYLALGS